MDKCARLCEKWHERDLGMSDYVNDDINPIRMVMSQKLEMMYYNVVIVT